jgi:hypothetical protein
MRKHNAAAVVMVLVLMYSRMQWDDDSGMPTKLVGFDVSEPTAHNQGKPAAIARIRQKQPYQSIVMIGGALTEGSVLHTLASTC